MTSAILNKLENGVYLIKNISNNHCISVSYIRDSEDTNTVVKRYAEDNDDASIPYNTVGIGFIDLVKAIKEIKQMLFVCNDSYIVGEEQYE